MRSIRKLGVESLERRSMLAGNIEVAVNGGVLVITGDNLGNGVSVQQLGEGKFFVSGFSLSGGATTTDGQAAGKVFTGAKSGIRVDLNAGPDVFVMSNSAFRRNQLAQQLSNNTAGPIQASPQAPDNTAPAVQSRILGNLTIATDEGNDGVGFGARVGTRDTNGNTTAGVVNINTGAGADRVVADRTEAFDDMIFDTGAGNDGVSANVARVGDFLFANLGDGADAFNSTNSRGFHSQIYGLNGNDAIQVANYRFTEEIFLVGGEGNNNIAVQGMSANALSVTAGSGQDNININGSSGLYTTYLVDTGAGNDNVQIQATWVNNLLKVMLGDGNDNLRVGTTETGDTLFDGGAGTDDFQNDGGNTLRSAEIRNFE